MEGGKLAGNHYGHKSGKSEELWFTWEVRRWGTAFEERMATAGMSYNSTPPVGHPTNFKFI